MTKIVKDDNDGPHNKVQPTTSKGTPIKRGYIPFVCVLHGWISHKQSNCFQPCEKTILCINEQLRKGIFRI